MSQKPPKAGRNGEPQPNGAESSLPCYVLELSVENVRCFGPKQTLKLTDAEGKPARWAIILGENGTGKTTLLQVLASMEDVNVPARAKGDWPDREIRAVDLFLRSEFPRTIIRSKLDDTYEDRKPVSKCDLVYDASVDDHPSPVTVRWGIGPNSIGHGHGFRPSCLCAYGAGRRLRGHATSDHGEDGAIGTLFSEHARLRNAEDWLLRLDYAAKSTSRQQEVKRLEEVKLLIASILPEKVDDIRFQTTTGPNPKQWVEFKTLSGWVPLHRLGYGYQTLIAWVLDFVSRMVERYPDSEDPLAEPAIVIVDEIDLHLHPAWQRKLIGFLSERFPNTQFIATAHSPLVVQAAEDANIAVLKRVGDHVEIVNDVDEIRGWRVDQILTSDLFGLKSARSPEAEKLFDRKQELLAKPKRTKADERELKELQEEIDRLPVGDSAAFAKEMNATHEALDLLKKHSPK